MIQETAHRRPRAATVSALTLLLAAVSLNVVVGGDWPGWRGSNRDGWAAGERIPTGLNATPSVLWRKSIGHGYAAPVVAAGKLVYLDDTGGKETAHCIEAATGKEVWAEAYHENYADEFEPGPRCTPLINGDRVYVQSCRGEFRCLNLADGSTRWRFHFNDHGAFWVPEKNSNIGAANRRGNSGSPVIDGDRVFVQVGGTNNTSIMAFDKRTGALAWKSQNDLTCYSSLAWGTLGGRRQVVAATCEGLLGLATTDGSLLWRVPFKTGANRNVLTPIIDGDTVNFSSHTTGFRRTRIATAGEGQEVKDDWFNREVRINLSTPVRVGEHFYGVGPDALKVFLCIDRRTGAVAWSQPGYGLVAAVITDGERLLVLMDSGECRIVAADPAQYRELGRFQACGKSYVHPALAQGVLYVRDARELVAYTLNP